MKVRISVLLFVLSFYTQAQNKVKYWFFIQEDYSLHSVCDSLKNYNVEIENKSNWLHAVTFSVDSQQHFLFQKPYCISFQEVRKLKTNKIDLSTSDKKYLSVLNELHAVSMRNQRLNGKGIKIGIIDAGYQRADSNEYFSSLFEQKLIKATKDFVNPEKTDFYAKEYKGDSHGREVWKRIGGYSKKKDLITGFATEADYYLARSENADVEQRIEEDNWVAAIEWMDSLGVRLINTSLGYANMFDDTTDNYAITDMNGNTSVISRAAKKAISEKNMIIISSAGNEGRNNNWQIVTAPADVEEIITVGAVKPKTRVKADYSSIGPDFNKYNKPDVVCPSASGTSFAAPIITGLVACILEREPNLSLDSVKAILFQASHLYPYPNNYVGYGIPDCKKIVSILEKEPLKINSTELKVSGTKFKSDFEKSDSTIIVYHKINATLVSETFEINPSSIIRLSKKYRFKKRRKENKLTIYQPEGIQYTTIDTGNKIIELEWLD